jgi:hypothetical protein
MLAPLARTLEVLQVRRRLVLLDRHQVAVRANEIAFATDEDRRIILGAIVLVPERIPAPAVGGPAVRYWPAIGLPPLN